MELLILVSYDVWYLFLQSETGAESISQLLNGFQLWTTQITTQKVLCEVMPKTNQIGEISEF